MTAVERRAVVVASEEAVLFFFVLDRWAGCSGGLRREREALRRAFDPCESRGLP